MAPIKISGREIGPGYPPYLIAEMSGNHNGQIERAYALIDAAADAGADAVKLQTYTPDTITIDHDGPGFRISGGPWDGRTLYDLYGEAQTPWEWHPQLFAHARARGLEVFSSPFDDSAIDFLETLDCPVYKIASFEAVDLPLIRRAARTGKPLIISTGLADAGEIAAALQAAREAAGAQVMLLHCVSGYPAPASDCNLRTISDMRQRFQVPIGLSDHTLGAAVSVAAVALGACVLEKHITLARAEGGPDAGFSLEPAEFAALARSVREGWEALGAIDYGIKSSERGNITFRRSLYAVADIARGETFTSTNVRSIRPGHGLPPADLPIVLRAVAARDIPRGTPLAWSDIEGGSKA